MPLFLPFLKFHVNNNICAAAVAAAVRRRVPDDAFCCCGLLQRIPVFFSVYPNTTCCQCFTFSLAVLSGVQSRFAYNLMFVIHVMHPLNYGYAWSQGGREPRRRSISWGGPLHDPPSTGKRRRRRHNTLIKPRGMLYVFFLTCVAFPIIK